MLTLGFGAMSRLARLSPNNCRLNIRSLARKLAVDEVTPAVCAQQVGKTYVIYSPAAILRRRKEAGLEWVVRSKGVAFVDPQSRALLTERVTPNGSRSGK
jgi:hypothetical protein